MGIIKNLKKEILLLSVIFFYGCPSICNLPGVSYSGTVNDLIKLYPIQEVYNIGDVITYSVVIPSHITNFGPGNKTIDLYEETEISKNPFDSINIDELKDNDVVVLEGENSISGTKLVANLLYNPDEREYRYKAKITLTKPGNYSINLPYPFTIVFVNPEVCKNYLIETNVEGFDDDEIVTFTVQ